MPGSTQKITFGSERLVKVVRATNKGETDHVLQKIKEMKEQKRIDDQIQAEKEKQEEARRQYAKKNKEAAMNKAGTSSANDDKGGSKSTATANRKGS